MNRISKEDILAFHKIVQDSFPKHVLKGKSNMGLIEAIADKPFNVPMGSKSMKLFMKKRLAISKAL